MNKWEREFKRKGLHRKINGEAICYCGGDMFLWKGSLWFCEKEIVTKAMEIKRKAVKR